MRGPFLITLLCVIFTQTRGSDIPLLFLVPFSGWPVGADVAPALEMAVDEINDNPLILPNNKLRYELFDDQCNPLRSVEKSVAVLTNSSEVRTTLNFVDTQNRTSLPSWVRVVLCVLNL
jgi:hypothetical protein